MRKYLISLVIILVSCSNPINDNDSSQDKFKIASWNIQIFGQSKLKDTLAMSVIKEVCKDFDIIAIQEIRSKEQNVIPTLIDSLGSDYTYVISRRLGRTISKEQYAFIYRNDIELIDTFQTADPYDQIHREPFAVKFKLNNEVYTFLNIHTDPDIEETESYLLDTLLSKQENGILLGDLNRHPEDYDNDYFFENYCSAIGENEYTNLANSHSYDNFIFDCSFDFDGKVYNFKDTFNLSLETAKEVSDHYPVWIEIK